MAQSKATSTWSILIVGIFLGVIIGLSMALAAAWKVLGGEAIVEVFASKDRPVASQRIPDNGAATKNDPGRISYDYHKVLPEGSNIAEGDSKTALASKTTEQRTTAVASLQDPPSTRPIPGLDPGTSTSSRTASKSRETYWLQVGSFSRMEDAETRQGELAIQLGLAATIQQGAAPGRGALYRVRVGPFDSVEQTNRIKTELAQRNFDAALVRQ